jgi:uncharacterized protein (TIGR02001 family)
MNTFKISGLTVLSCLLASSALAQENSPWTLGGSAALTSDYVFRGFSQTDEHPAAQASVSLNHDSGFSASLWGSNVDFNDGDEASVEIDGTLSYTHEVGPGKATIGGIYYAYPGADSDLDYDYVEAFAGYAFNIGEAVDVNAQVFYSPDFFAGSGDAVYTTAGLSIPVKPVEGLAVVGSAGHQWIDDNASFGADDYTDWSAGLSYTWEKANFSVKYYDTDIDDNDFAESRVVGAVSVSFP